MKQKKNVTEDIRIYTMVNNCTCINNLFCNKLYKFSLSRYVKQV